MTRGRGSALSSGGNPAIAAAFDPVFGGPACTTAPASDQGTGLATYRLPAAVGSGFTLLGSPTVTARMRVTGKYAYIAARLLDVDPATNTETLVARGVYRVDPTRRDPNQTFQLHAGGWHFAAGHVPTLQLLGQDSPYTRPANGAFSIVVSHLELRIPIHEAPVCSAPTFDRRPATIRRGPPCGAPPCRSEACRSRPLHRP